MDGSKPRKMKKIGLLGGITYQSTVHYYMHINNRISGRLGGCHSAELLLYSFDFAEIETFQRAGDWAGASLLFQKACQWLKDGGAELIVICANTMHIIADDLEKATGLPILHIADLTASAVKEANCKTVGLLGTRYTMQMPFYRDRLTEKHGLEVLVPEQESMENLHRIIIDELAVGEVKKESKKVFLDEIKKLQGRGADTIVLGCTEIPMLIGQDDTELVVIDTTKLHAVAAADWAIDNV